jgi:hypothetical protein
VFLNAELGNSLLLLYENLILQLSFLLALLPTRYITLQKDPIQRVSQASYFVSRTLRKNPFGAEEDIVVRRGRL